MKPIFIAITFLLSTYYLYGKDFGQPANIFEENTKKIVCEDNVSFLQDNRGLLTIQQILLKSAPFKFRQSKGSAPTLANYGTPIWVKFIVANNTSKFQKTILTLPSYFYENLELYITKNDSIFEPTQQLSWRIPQEKRPIPNRNFIFRLNIPAGETVVCYLKIQKDFGSISFPITLWTEDYFNYKFYAFDYTFWGVIIGSFIFIAFFAFLIFLAIRDRIYTIYGFYVLCMLGYLLSSQGFFIRYYQHGFWGIEANKLNYYFALLILIFSAAFTYDYLRLKDHPNNWIAISFRAMIYFLLFLQLFMYADHLFLHDYLYRSDRNLLTSTFTLFLWVPSIIVFGTLIYCIISNYRRIEAIYYTFAISPLFFLVIYTAFSNYGWFHGTYWGGVNYFAVAFLIEGIILSFALAFRFKVIKEGREKLLVEKNYLLQQQTQVIIEAEERERIRIARDLHDGIGQLLAAARMGLGGSFFRKHDEKSLQTVLDLLEDSIKEIRNLSHNMMPNVLLKLGLTSAIQNLVDKANNSSNLNVTYNAIDMTERLDDTIEMGLYRVVQEAFSNILKHSKATKVVIQLIKYSEELVLTIEDNGIGFDIKDIKSQGIGLKNIITRVEYLNGFINFESSPQQGTMIIIELPLLQSHGKQTKNFNR